MSRVERDPERRRAAAVKLRALGAKRILIKAAQQGYITQVALQDARVFLPRGAWWRVLLRPVSSKWSDWMPTVEHFPVYNKDGGKETVDNVILAHRLCNRLDHSLRVGRPHARDLERIRKAREEGIRRNNVQIGNTEGVTNWDWSRIVLDHVKIGVQDAAASKRFYGTVLAPLEIPPLWESDQGAQYANLVVSGKAATATPLHIAFVARSREEVDAFHRAGIEAGFQGNGAPGVREQYSSEAAGLYYAAFLLDPDGNNIEAVYRQFS